VFEEVRGMGLMLGLKCKAPNTDIVQAGYSENLLTVPAADNVIRLLPPLNITDTEIEDAVSRLEKAATRVALAL
jgi:acetylornithine/N-succinyldiaminopimelate aminotransferase